MDTVNILLYLVIFLILFYVFYKFILTSRANFVNIQEGLLGVIDKKEFDTIKDHKDFLNIESIKSIENKYAKLPIKDYCIKASYNSAITGKSVNKDMVKFVLSRGCRFIDLEVFYIKKNKNYIPVVAQSSDPNYKVFDTDNDINLEEIFSTIVSNSFSNVSPNKKDPLFLHLRIKTKDTNCYAAVSKMIDSVLKPKLHDGEVTRDTKLADIMGKIVIVIDKTIHRDYKDYAKCRASDISCFDLSNYMNMESGSQNMNSYSLTQIESQAFSSAMIKDDNVSTTAVASKLVLPHEKTKENPDIGKMILNYGAQIVCYRYNLVDTHLVDAETLFNDNRGGIIPLAAAIPYCERIRKEEKNAGSSDSGSGMK